MAIYTSTSGLGLKKKRNGLRKLVLSVYANCLKILQFVYTQGSCIHQPLSYLSGGPHPVEVHIYIYMVFPSCVPEMDFQYLLDIIQNGNPCKFCNANYIPSRFSYLFNKIRSPDVGIPIASFRP